VIALAVVRISFDERVVTVVLDFRHIVLFDRDCSKLLAGGSTYCVEFDHHS
jgi:hypothetical protein